MKKIQYMIMAAAAMIVLTACEKVSPIGVLVSGTGVEDRVKMSNLYFKEHKLDIKYHDASDKDEYTFLVGADSHMALDGGRMREMLQNGLDSNDEMVIHLGDIADTKAEYYILLEDIIDEYRWKYAKKHYDELYIGDSDDAEGSIMRQLPANYVYVDSVNDMVYSTEDVPYPFYAIVGNHDITHNGWAMWSNIFHSSFYDIYVLVDNDNAVIYDHFIFLDSASGTLGKEQVKLIEDGIFEIEEIDGVRFGVRNTFVFTHTNIFRPASLQFSSTMAREEMFFLLNKFDEWHAKMVFMGHVHKWDYRTKGDTEFLTLDSMGERNSPEPGDYLVRVHVKKDGSITWEKVHMSYKK